MVKTFFFIFTSIFFIFLGCESLPKDESEIKNNVNTTTQKEELSSESMDFISKMNSINIQVVSHPSVTSKNKPFNAPYVIYVTQDGKAAQNFSIDISFPSSKSDNEIIYASEKVMTGNDGRLSFMPKPPAFAADDFITFCPSVINNDDVVIQAAKEKAAKAKWQVRTDYTAKQGMIYVFDYDERGRVGNNSFTMLRALRNIGFNIGNSPISDSSYLTRSTNDLYRATKSIAGDTFGVLVSGSVKYDGAIKKVETGYECRLIADIVCINMTDGSIIYATTQRKSSIAKTESAALTQCRETLASDVAASLLYNL